MKPKSLFKSVLLLPVLAMLFTACETVTRVPISQQTGHEHTYTFHQGNPATCLTAGMADYYTCDECGKYFDVDKNPTTWTQLKVAALGHDLEHHEAQDWDNGQPGHIEYYECLRCHKNFSDDRGTVEVDDLADVCHHSLMQGFPRQNPTFQAPGHIAYYYCGGCLKYFYDVAGTEEIVGITSDPLNEDDPRYLPQVHSETDEFSVFNALPDNVMNYLGAESEADIIAALKDKTSDNRQNLKTISWQDVGTTPYYVYFGTLENLSDAEVFTTNEPEYTFPALLVPGTTYYYKVIDTDENVIKDVSSFKVDDTYTLKTANIDNVQNVRDLGGWSARGNATIPYNKLYRGGRLSYISEKGKDQFFNEYKINTEIDLRSDGYNETNGTHNYQKCGMHQYTAIIPGYTSPDRHNVSDGTSIGPIVHDPTSLPSIKKIFEILADESNYPIYFHCNAGADRTGTLAYLIGGLLGVSYEDLVKDFELTTFSAYGDRYRSPVVGNEFQKDGEMAGIFECDDKNYVAFGKLHEIIMDRYGKGGNDIALAVENYLITECGLNRETLTQVRRALLGSDQSFDYLVDVNEIKTLIDDLDSDMSSPFKSSTLTKVQGYMRFLDNAALADIGEDRLATYNAALAAFEQKYALAQTFQGKTTMGNYAYGSKQNIVREEYDETFGTVYVVKVVEVAVDGGSGCQVLSFLIIPGDLQYKKIRFAIYCPTNNVYLGYLYYQRSTLSVGWNEFQDDLSQSQYDSVKNRTKDFWIRIQATNTSVDFHNMEFKITDIYYEK